MVNGLSKYNARLGNFWKFLDRFWNKCQGWVFRGVNNGFFCCQMAASRVSHDRKMRKGHAVLCCLLLCFWTEFAILWKCQENQSFCMSEIGWSAVLCLMAAKWQKMVNGYCINQSKVRSIWKFLDRKLEMQVRSCFREWVKVVFVGLEALILVHKWQKIFCFESPVFGSTRHGHGNMDRYGESVLLFPCSSN